MFVFRRSVTLANAANVPKALNFSVELCGYFNKTYGVNLRTGLEMFGPLNMHWQFESDTLDKMNAINTKLLDDKGYWSILEKNKDLWVHGSLKDTVINLIN